MKSDFTALPYILQRLTFKSYGTVVAENMVFGEFFETLFGFWNPKFCHFTHKNLTLNCTTR